MVRARKQADDDEDDAPVAEVATVAAPLPPATVTVIVTGDNIWSRNVRYRNKDRFDTDPEEAASLERTGFVVLIPKE